VKHTRAELLATTAVLSGLLVSTNAHGADPLGLYVGASLGNFFLAVGTLNGL